MLSTKITYSSSKFVLKFNFIKEINDKLEKTLEFNTPGLNNPETYVLTHKRFNISLVLIIDLNKAEVYKLPCRDCSHHEIEIVLSFD